MTTLETVLLVGFTAITAFAAWLIHWHLRTVSSLKERGDRLQDHWQESIAINTQLVDSMKFWEEEAGRLRSEQEKNTP